MPKHPCPICRDPNAYPLWVTKDKPEGCPADRVWHAGGPVTIKNVGECPLQRRRAEQQALFRKVAPECFDENGNMLPGKLADVLMKCPPDIKLVL